MANFGNMQTRIRRELNRDGLTADIVDHIVTAIKYYKGTRFFFNEKEATASIGTGTTAIVLPTGAIEIDEVILMDSNGYRYELKERDWETLNLRDTTVNSFPDEWALYRDVIHLRPPCDRALTVQASYHAELTDVSASASGAVTNAWMTDAEALIRSRAKETLYRHRLRNKAQADEMKDDVRDELRALEQQTAKKLSTGRFKKTRF